MVPTCVTVRVSVDGYVTRWDAEALTVKPEPEIEAQRGGGEGKGHARYACVHRDRPIDESLTEFRAMRDGKYKPKEASLRMKQDINNPNPQMWDVAAYRILEKNDHFRTGTKWRIYPTYDFTHCLCDSFEGITHSLCTTEFEMSRESYDWLINKLGVYKPMQREYGRLNLTGTVLSKRKLIDLVEKGYVKGWDDPRLYTLIALRRRGIPPGAILSFVNDLGVTKNTINIMISRFEQTIRSHLEFSVPRLMMVLDPISVIIDDLPDDHLEMVENPFQPKDPSFGVCIDIIPPACFHRADNSRLTKSHSPNMCTLTAATSAKRTTLTTSAWRRASWLV